MESKYQVYPEEFCDIIIITIDVQAPESFAIVLEDLRTTKMLRAVGVDLIEGKSTIKLEGLQDLPGSEYVILIKSNGSDLVYRSPQLKKIVDQR